MKIEKIIKLDHAKAGQLLVKDVCDIHGNCLIAAGIVLSDAHLSRLQTKNIEYLTVCHEQHYSEDEITKQQTLVKEKLAQRFRHVKDNPEMCRLHDILLAFRLEGFSESDEQDAKKDQC